MTREPQRQSDRDISGNQKPLAQETTRERSCSRYRSPLSILITAAVFVYCDWRFMSWRAFKWGMDETRFASALAMISMGAQILYLAVVVVGFQLLGSLTFLGVSFFTFMHFAAAVLLIVNLSFAAASHAFPTKLNKQIQGGTGAGAPHPVSYTHLTLPTSDLV